MRSICIFTSTRAEWGLLQGVAKLIRDADDLKLQLLVSGTHLSENFGMTISEIIDAGFDVSEQVDILQFDDSEIGVCKTMGLALSEYGSALNRLDPDLLVVLGDRYETFCVAAAAQILRIPIAHIHGGETTEGAVDEAFRHSITKMSHLHFPACEEYCNRVIQLGENPDHVFNVGSLGVENIRKIKLMSRDELAESINFDLSTPYFLVTFHPVTLENNTAEKQFDELVSAVNEFPEHNIIFTKANADADGEIVNNKIESFARENPDRVLAVTSLGQLRYLSALKYCDAVIGNSSSGIIEAPALQVPTVNTGDRQKGRIRTSSIIDCEPQSDSIIEAIKRSMDSDFKATLKHMKHPCEQQNTAAQIVNRLQQVDLSGALKKSFRDLC